MSSSAIWQSKTRIVRDGKNLDAHVTLTDSGLRFAYKDKAEFIELNRVRDVRIKVVENRFTHAKHQTGWVGFSIDGEKHRTEVFASSQSEALASGIDAAIQRMASRSSISPDKFASIADEIRTLVPNNVSEALLRVMGELRRSNPGSVYLASRKYLNIAGKKAADYGFVGLIWEWVRGTGDEYAATPFDVGLYLRPAKVQTGDVILTYYIDTKKELEYFHGRVASFDSSGSIELTNNDGNNFNSRQEFIMGKLSKVLRFGEPEWHELFGQVADREELAKTLKSYIDWIEQGNQPKKSEHLADLNRKLTLLTAGSR